MGSVGTAADLFGYDRVALLEWSGDGVRRFGSKDDVRRDQETRSCPRLGTPKWLLALDEPTNHLDLPSIERLQTELESYRGAVLVITHDDALAESITDTIWSVNVDEISITS